ncbi:PREDICTED: cellular tumor antigen p53 [Vollenhovia emeryi]|uniref:cellular tumor antigen p53 n=1 Tax=Vollenhovia emeryi TaxID=411798 RepID=UPI0005F4BA72|nr:PREDICTED: cellular tumor antigen p53 [Vollenhovia emeryi]
MAKKYMSDSQESTLIDDEAIQHIRDSFAGDLPFSELDIPEDKFVKSADSVGKKQLKRYYEEEMPQFELYSSPYNDDMVHSWNLQYTFGEGGAQDWVYSEALKKLFIKMEKVLPLRFSWEPHSTTSNLFLRTRLTFVLDEHKSDPVRRCLNHSDSSVYVNQSMESERIKHVVHCVNHACFYREEKDHLSVVTPLCAPESGSQYVPMCFKFFCKNSCPSGINRRGTELVFTLENEIGQILASQTLLIRICSCPKRDKQKEEDLKEVPAKRQLVLTQNKKMCTDKHVYKIELNVVGKENSLAVYKYAYDVMAGQAAKTGQHEFYKPYMDDILHKIP